MDNINHNRNNNKGQERVVTRKTLREYIEWINQTKGDSYIDVESGTTGSGVNLAYTITLKSILADAAGHVVTDGSPGLGIIHWNAVDGASVPLTAVTTQDGQTLTISYRPSSPLLIMPPRGKFFLTYNGHDYTELDNSKMDKGKDGSKIPSLVSYKGFVDVTFNEDSGNTNDDYCVTFEDIETSVYARAFDPISMSDGLIVNKYSVGDGKNSYDDNQLVVEKDVNYGKFQYNLEVSAITVEVDAMNDTAEYTGGNIPWTTTPYAVVYDTSYNEETEEVTRELFTDYILSKPIGDNSDTSAKTYSAETISKYGNNATATLNRQNNTYSVIVQYYNSDGVLTSSTVSTPVGTAKSVTFNTTILNTQTTYKTAKVTIAANGQLSFDVLQRAETYGYFEPSIYTVGNANFGVITENAADFTELAGNVSRDKINEFKVASSNTTTTTSFTVVQNASYGWLDNAGDNYGQNALTTNKVMLAQSDASVYDTPLTEQGITGDDRLVCAQDVYNTNNTVFDRGVSVKTYHIAYANDAYGNNNYTGGLRNTQNLYIDSGTVTYTTPTNTCTTSYLDYTYKTFESEYKYNVNYLRTYRKEQHAYGRTSILRRFRYYDGNIHDSASLSYTDNGSVTGIVNGNTFPKHIKTKSLTYSVINNFTAVDVSLNNFNIKSGTHDVSGWTTVYETGVTSSDTYSRYSDPTLRNVIASHKGNSTTGYYIVSAEENSSESVKYLNIAPRFYMLDAETCTGISSGYSFNIDEDKNVVDKTGGVTETRYYHLDVNNYLKEIHLNPGQDGYTSTQDLKRDYVSYLTGSDVGERYNYAVDGSYCTPYAPLETIKWIDTIAPNAGRLSGATVLYENEFAGGVTTETTRVVPMTDSWGSFTNTSITISDINYPNSYSDTNSSRMIFTGDNNYKLGHSNNSSRSSMNSSVNFTINNAYVSTMSSQIGAQVPSDSPTIDGAQHAVVLNSDNDAITNYKYYSYYGNTNTVSTSSTYTNKYKFVDVESKYQNGVYLRRCIGDVTVPVWNLKINYNIDNSLGSNSKQGIKVKINGTEITSGSSGVMVSGARCYLATNVLNICVIHPTEPRIWISPISEASATNAQDSYNNYIKNNISGKETVTLGVVVSNYFPSSGSFTIKVESYNDIFNDTTPAHTLSWKVNTRTTNAINPSNNMSLTTIVDTMVNDNSWNEYEDNTHTVLLSKDSKVYDNIASMRNVLYFSENSFNYFLNQMTLNARQDDNSEKNHTYWW